jgi:primosomal protein N'
MRSKDPREVEAWADMYAKSLQAYAGALEKKRVKLVVGDASSSALEKADGYYRWQIVLRADASSQIVRAWKWICSERPVPKTVVAVLVVDAYNLV